MRIPNPRSSSARSNDGGASDFVLNAALAALVAFAAAIGICMAVALIAWFFANGGAHGNTIDALRAGGLAWVLGLGGSAESSIGHVGLTPLGLTAINVVAIVRAVRWGWRRSAEGDKPPSSGLLAASWAVFVVTYVILVMIVAATFGSNVLNPSEGGAVGCGFVVAALCSVWSWLVATGRIGVWWSCAPDVARAVVRIAVWAAGALVVVAIVLVGLSLALSFSEAKATYSALGVSFGDGLILTVLCVISLPNAVGFAVAYLAGPGFAVGTATSVTVTSVSLGALPLFPTVAALPDPGHQTGWLIVLLFVPGVCALVAAGRIQREYDDGWDQVLLRGLVGGAVAGVVVAIFAGISGGALGDHRMSDIGASFWPVLLCAVGGMALGGALGALIVAGWQRLREPRLA